MTTLYFNLILSTFLSAYTHAQFLPEKLPLKKLHYTPVPAPIPPKLSSELEEILYSDASQQKFESLYKICQKKPEEMRGLLFHLFSQTSHFADELIQGNEKLYFGLLKPLIWEESSWSLYRGPNGFWKDSESKLRGFHYTILSLYSSSEKIREDARASAEKSFVTLKKDLNDKKRFQDLFLLSVILGDVELLKTSQEKMKAQGSYLFLESYYPAEHGAFNLLHMAALLGHSEMLQYIGSHLSLKSDLNLGVRCDMGRIQTVRYSKEKCILNPGATALHLASLNGAHSELQPIHWDEPKVKNDRYRKSVEVLFELGAHPGAFDKARNVFFEMPYKPQADFETYFKKSNATLLPRLSPLQKDHFLEDLKAYLGLGKLVFLKFPKVAEEYSKNLVRIFENLLKEREKLLGNEKSNFFEIAKGREAKLIPIFHSAFENLMGTEAGEALFSQLTAAFLKEKEIEHSSLNALFLSFPKGPSQAFLKWLEEKPELQNNSFINMRDRFLRTPLYISLERCDFKNAEEILKKRADPDIETPSFHVPTPLFLAVACREKDWVSALLKARARKDVLNRQGRTAAQYADSIEEFEIATLLKQ